MAGNLVISGPSRPSSSSARGKSMSLVFTSEPTSKT
eukprot:CAMPEP_0198220268 /NCGR_PEP_ID=MMETSP1445-20131203/78377_1 /TAXON_ID=36898 /ORGANISM="Pyramimonas sp., Strain CCMP2087" /LENGTH=35 /DNA_ID= /DNA_START= /DNA_END= /DNA_ORIENTATION=